MQGYEGKIYHVSGATVILNLDGWSMYVLVGDKVHIFTGWPYEQYSDDALPFPLVTPQFEDFLISADIKEVVNHLSDVHMTLYRSESKVRDELIGIVTALQRGLAADLKNHRQGKTSA